MSVENSSLSFKEGRNRPYWMTLKENWQRKYNFNYPTPTDSEIELENNKAIVSKTDAFGVIEYGNEYFVRISGYKEEELIGAPHSIIRHPDMPKVIFKLMWERLSLNKNIYALVKNLAKNGDYYWVITDFRIKVDKRNDKVSYIAIRNKPPKEAIYEIEKLYKKLVKIEREKGVAYAEKFLNGYLESKNLSYDEYIDKITKNNKLKKSWFNLILRKLFM